MIPTLCLLALIFTQLSILSFGGGNAILPALQHQAVNVQHWVSADQFQAMFALAQAAPGPNMMIIPLLGWHVAGPLGLVVTCIAKFGPTSVITLYALKFWDSFKTHPFKTTLELALQPITVGLVLSSAWLIAEASVQQHVLIAVVVLTSVLGLVKKIHPIYLMSLGAGLAAVFL